MEYIKEFIKHKESKGEKAIYRVNDTRGYTYYSDDYVMWLEQQLLIHDVSGSLPLQTKLEMFYDFLYERGVAKQLGVGIDTIVKHFIDEKLSGNDR